MSCAYSCIAPADHIGDQAHGGLWREDVGAAGDIFLEDVVLNSTAVLIGAGTPFLGGGDVHC